MNTEELTRFVEEALDGLKDFQAASVEALHRRLYREDGRCMLLADEVGLGKTVVAKGLIARVLQERIEAGTSEPFKVTYICSNQVIAQENLRKLNLFPEGIAMKPPVSRIAYLAHPEVEDGDRQTLLELNTLTPATSFRLTSGTGRKEERCLIYTALVEDESLAQLKKGLGWMLKGTVTNMRTFRQHLDNWKDWVGMREDLPGRFLDIVRSERVPRSAENVYRELPGDDEYSLYEAVRYFSERVNRETLDRYWWGCWDLSRRLREAFVQACLPYVDADLYILDEFQRFRDLIDNDSEEDHAKLAQKIFFEQRSDTRILLLSATPFKAFTGSEELERGEDHYEDFRRVLRFLMRDDPERLGRYEQHRQALYGQILELRGGEVEDLNPGHRKAVEEILRSVMCRTERHSVAADPNALVHDVWKTPEGEIPFDAGDIENFRFTDRLARALVKVDVSVGKPIEYCKSALFPLSYLDRYQFKDHLRKHRSDPEISRALRETAGAWLDLKKIDSYTWSPSGESRSAGNGKSGGSNARLEKLIEQSVGPHGAKLLWIPPSLPYYELEDAFEGTIGFSKTLLFSSWIMVPRMVSTLVSYEVEKRTVGDRDTVDEQEVERRTYFTPEGKKRHPIPQLRFARRSGEGGSQLANMSNFTLLYPSQTLAGLAAPIENLRHRHSLSDLRMQVKEGIQNRLGDASLERFATPSGEGERWYWAAPLLLDRSDPESRNGVQQWFNTVLATSQEDPDAEEEHPGAKGEHFRHLKDCFEDPKAIGLGRMPGDLAEVLADLALGSPAVIALRSLRRLFSGEEADLHLPRAFRIADEFLSLFNKPESIAAVRLSEKHEWYWRMVADYCGSGCLQAVLDEYFHLLRGQNVNPESAVAQLIDAINLNVASINVDSLETFVRGTPRKMRCHYAVEFGSQRIETDRGRKRASGIREVFNSPFRPFVLATTSIGQEGLDFHSYCRRIVHWNLPGNPVDLEQREGRINRFKSLVIRQQVAKKYGPSLSDHGFDPQSDIWETLFAVADREERLHAGKCELIPFWHVEAQDDCRIERIIPLYPFSADRGRLTRILRTLAIYRLAFGQPRQAELVEHLLDRDLSDEEIGKVMETLMVNLSPIRYGKEESSREGIA